MPKVLQGPRVSPRPGHTLSTEANPDPPCGPGRLLGGGRRAQALPEPPLLRGLRHLRPGLRPTSAPGRAWGWEGKGKKGEPPFPAPVLGPHSQGDLPWRRA